MRVLVVAAFVACASCAGDARPPIVAPSVQPPPPAPLSMCPPGTERRAPSVCEATEAIVADDAPPVKVRVDCYRFNARRFDIDSDDAPEPPFARAREHTHLSETCGKDALEFTVPPGPYTVTINGERTPYFFGGATVVDLVRASTRSGGTRALPENVASAGALLYYGHHEDEHRMSYAMHSQVGHVDSDATEIVVAQLTPGATAIDQIVALSDGDAAPPKSIGGVASALAASDGDVVVIPQGKLLRVRFPLRARGDHPVLRFLVRAQRLAAGEPPIVEGTYAPASDVSPDECPRGAAREGVGCVARDPAVRADAAPVRVTFRCPRYPTGLLPSARVPKKIEDADRTRLLAEARAEHGNGRAAYVECTSPMAIDLAPGAYRTIPSIASKSQYHFQIPWLFVHPRTPTTQSLDAEGTTHCPRLSAFDPTHDTYDDPDEIFQGMIGRAQRDLTVSRRKVVASKGVIVIRLNEVEPEEAFIDMLRLDWNGHSLAPLEGGARSVLADVDDRALHMTENTQVHVTFRLPEPISGEVAVEFVGAGYYDRRDGT